MNNNNNEDEIFDNIFNDLNDDSDEDIDMDNLFGTTDNNNDTSEDEFDAIFDKAFGDNDDDNQEDEFDDLFNKAFDDSNNDLMLDNNAIFNDLFKQSGESATDIPDEVIISAKDSIIKDSLDFIKWMDGICYSKIAGSGASSKEISKKLTSLAEKYNSIDVIVPYDAANKFKSENHEEVFEGFVKKMCVLQGSTCFTSYIETKKKKISDFILSVIYSGIVKCNSFIDMCSYTPPRINGIDDVEMNNCLREVREYLELLNDIWYLSGDLKEETMAAKEIKNQENTLTSDIQLISEHESTKDFWDFPESITCNNGKYKLKCSHCHNVIEVDNIIDFNIINYSDTTQSYTALNKLTTSNDNAKIWLDGLRDCQEILKSTTSTSELITELNSIEESAANFIRNTVGSALYVNINNVCSCGRHLILPDRLLRFLACWHVNKGETIFRNISTNTEVAIGKVRYADNNIMGAFNMYREAVDAVAQKELDALNNWSISDEYEINNEASEQVINARRDILKNIGINVEQSDDIETSRSLQEAFDNIIARSSKYNLLFDNYTEMITRNKYAEEKKKDDKQIKSSGYKTVDYWRQYNTSTDDRLLYALYYLANTLNLDYNLEPKAVLSDLLNQPENENLKNTILKQSIFIRIKSLDSVLHSYHGCSNTPVIENDMPVLAHSGTNGIWSLDSGESEHIRLMIVKLLQNFIELSMGDTMFSSDEVKLLKSTDVLDLSTTCKLVNKFISGYDISNYMNYRGSNSFKFESVLMPNAIDESIVTYVTDELPWRVWYKLALVDMIARHNPKLLEAFANQGKAKTGKGKLEVVVKKLKREIISGAEKKDPYSGEFLWSKISSDLRTPTKLVLNKNLEEVALCQIVSPEPLTNELIAIILQSDTEEDAKAKMTNYMRTDYRDDVISQFSNEENTVDIGGIDVDVLWEDTVEWIKRFSPKDFKYALPKYLSKVEEVK
jgi:hypothetical protein